ncbi:hypothetical protein BGZ97_005292 [Linnemannia gamsii]|uniref:Carrier domain-containing protein n=1 Tax=Linnemannia gamsii TaxID=64522 RepID=A0A9P6UWN6_9FUNG|nr:hypothetical protein BGZ97_005292 [Linnemannia gamsii]
MDGFGRALVAQRVADVYNAMVQATNQAQSISDIDLLDAAERQQLLVDWNDTVKPYPQGQCLHQLFEAQVERTPEAIALVYEDQELSYAELNARANRLAHQLIELGVGPDKRVAICVARSPAMVEVISIGRPLANTRIYVLDAYGQPVPLGIVGELYIGGVGVARGYLNRPELTAERFLPDPFSNQVSARMYKTGDLVRYLPDGNVKFLGRNDHQIKIRGFRIEPGEIEARLIEHPLVHEAAVLALGEGSEKRLIAYVVAEAVEQLASMLREHLAPKLSDYMMPSAFVRLDALPLTPNGKLDRQALPTLSNEDFAHQAYEAPQGEIEITLVNIWAEVLQAKKISRYDDFFALGGHSILAMRMISHARKRDADQPIYGLQARGFDGVSPLAETVDAMVADYIKLIRRLQPKGPYHLLGWSLGGSIAHSIAVQLEQQDEKVVLLALLDSRSTYSDDSIDLQEELKFFYGEAMARYGDETMPTEETSFWERSLNIHKNNVRLAQTLSPLIYSGDMLYFRATIPQGESKLRAPLDLWKPYVLGNIEIRDIHSTHNYMDEQAPMAEIGLILAQKLDQLQETQPSQIEVAI